jgi:hypothetical protein
MGKPTPEELDTALAEAARLREQGEDANYLGKALLNHHYRLGLCEDLLTAAKRYMHSGEASRAHQELLRAIERAEAAARPEGDPDWPAGL